MDVCHILLGRPWQYDRSAKHDGRKNVYELEKDEIKHKLMPLQEKEESRGRKRVLVAVERRRGKSCYHL